MDYIKELIAKQNEEEEESKTLLFVVCGILLVALLGGLIYLIVKKSRENALSEFDFELEDEEYEDEFDESDHHSVYIDLRNENDKEEKDAELR